MRIRGRMKNKVKLIDVSILSSYMGRSFTGLATILVLALTLSSLMGEEGIFNHTVIEICVYEKGSAENLSSGFEPIKVLLAAQTRRPIILKTVTQIPAGGFDLCIMSASDFFELEGVLDITPIYTLRLLPAGIDTALLIAARDWEPPDFSRLRPPDLLFSSPNSLNGFLVQISLLAKRGFQIPERISELHFGASTADDYSRIVFGILYGAYRLGACRESDLIELAKKGLVSRGEVRIVAKSEALPEIIIASVKARADYYRDKLRQVDSRFRSARGGQLESMVELARARGFYGLLPVEERQIKESRELYQLFRDQF